MNTNALRLLLGRVVDGRYLLEEWLGGGSFGGVFLAGEYVDDRRLRTVAVKLLPAEPGDAGEAQRRELEVSLNLDHPNLLRCFSAGRCEVEGFDVLYLTMEVAEGSLEERLKSSRFSEAETRELAVSLASALSHLHAKNLVHRDVKPGNLLKVGDVWKLADFGLVRAFAHTQMTASGGKGTALYMSPEAVQGQTGPHVDVWALGVLLQQAASGVLAYTGESEAELIAALLTKEPTIAAGLPAWLDALVQACLSKERSKRPEVKDVPKMLEGRPAASVRAIPSASPNGPSAREADPYPPQFQLVCTLKGHRSCVNSVAFSPNGQTLASGGSDAKVRLWNAVEGRLLSTLKGIPVLFEAIAVCSVAFSPDGRTLASCGMDGKVRLWDAATGQLIRGLKSRWSPFGWASSVAFSPDGRTLASCGSAKTVRLWDAATGRPLRMLEGHAGPVSSVAFSPDGRTLASGSDDQTVRLWDTATGELLRTLEGHSDRVSSVAFSPDGRTLASCGMDGKVRLCDAADGWLLRTLRVYGLVGSVAFSPDSRTLAGGTSHGTVCLWDASDGHMLHSLEGHAGRVSSVAFSLDGRTLASGGEDRTVRLWGVRRHGNTGDGAR